jgi:lactate racemase
MSAQARGIKLLSKAKARKIIRAGLEKIPLDKKKVLVICPDCTRSGPMPLIFEILAEELFPRVSKLDYLIALGTHQPMTRKAQNSLFGITEKSRSGKYSRVKIINHDWQNPAALRKVGTISAAEMAKISHGLLKQQVTVALNKLIFDYDQVIIYGPVFPHEVAGFSGGHKYLTPGIAGPEVINFTHWLGALITSFKIIGIADNPVRKVIERAAQMADLPLMGICSVVEGAEGLAGLFAGPVYESWKKAAALSARIHVKWVDKPYRLVISVIPEMYDDMWTGAKGMYKVEPVVADGGEVIIYGPHIKEISFTHGKVLDQVGYHCRDYFVKQWDLVKHFPGGVLAHSTHLKGLGTFENGVEKPRIKVTLATGISKERCEKLNLGYRDPGTLNPGDFEGQEKKGILVVPRAGEVLYRLKSQREAGHGKV